ncbi:MAG: hypothetical protein KatS3mg111_3386 [Pirellulaceae bacterium]|nr:MAG: hypothetical protein KatS3mg111_3386 [Pirellulaceae bacterium]
MVVQGRVQNGVIVLDGDVSLPEGAEVEIVVRVEPKEASDTMTHEQRRRLSDALARIDALPNENPGDTFSGADHDRVLYGGDV